MRKIQSYENVFEAAIACTSHDSMRVNISKCVLFEYVRMVWTNLLLNMAINCSIVYTHMLRILSCGAFKCARRTRSLCERLCLVRLPLVCGLGCVCVNCFKALHSGMELLKGV